MLYLENALDPYRDDLQAFLRPPTLFGKSLKISYDRNEGGWEVKELGVLARIWFIVIPFLGGSTLQESNQAVLEKNRVSILNRRGTTLTSRLFSLFHLEFSPKSSPPPSPLREERLVSPRAAPTPSAIKGISNPGVNCWINASLQVLFNLTPFKEALYSELTPNEDEPPSHFKARLAVQKAAREVYEEYKSPRSTPQSIESFVERLKNSLFSFKPASFYKGRSPSPLNEQQCGASTAVGPLLQALGIDNLLFMGCPLLKLPIASSFQQGLQHHFDAIDEHSGTHPNKFISPPKFLALQSQFIDDATGSAITVSPEVRAKWNPPLELNLSDFKRVGIDETPIKGRYRLVGVIQHSGGSWRSGHYTATLVQEDGSFMSANDPRISRTSAPSGINGISIYELLPS